MSDLGAPAGGFPASNPDSERDSWRLLLVVLGVLGLGAATLAAVNLWLT